MNVWVRELQKVLATVLCSTYVPCVHARMHTLLQAAAADKGNAELAAASKAEVDKLLKLKNELAAAQEA